MPGVTEEDQKEFEQLLEQQFEEKPDASEAGADGGGHEADADGPALEAGSPRAEESEGAGDAGDPPPEQHSETVRIGTRDVPLADVEALLEFNEWAHSNPDKMQAFGAYLDGTAEFILKQQQAAQEEQKPEIDWASIDPEVKAVYDTQQSKLTELEEKFNQLQNPITAWQNQQAEDAARAADQYIAEATKNITDKFSLDLTPDEIGELQLETAKLNIVPALRQSIPDPVRALETALETAVFKVDKFRDRVVQSQVASLRANEKRETAAAISGAGGSERGGVQQATDAAPADLKSMSREQRQQAMAAEIAESMRGTT